MRSWVSNSDPPPQKKTIKGNKEAMLKRRWGSGWGGERDVSHEKQDEHSQGTEEQKWGVLGARQTH